MKPILFYDPKKLTIFIRFENGSLAYSVKTRLGTELYNLWLDRKYRI